METRLNQKIYNNLSWRPSPHQQLHYYLHNAFTAEALQVAPSAVPAMQLERRQKY
jgi:hypothetical protein